MADKVLIRKHRVDDSIDELTKLLHSSYKSLADLGLKYLATHQSNEITKSRIEKGQCFIAEIDSKIIGLINYYPPGKHDAVELADYAWFGQFAVDPKFQKLGIGKLLLEQTEKYSLSQKNFRIGLDTAEPATHLIDWYKKLGYRFHSYTNWDLTNYRSVIMIKDL